MTLLIIFLACQIGFNLVNSRLDAYLIMKHKTIAHFINFAAYAIVVIIELVIAKYGWWFVALFCIAAFFNRQVTFDIPLNLRRKLDYWYISLEKPPKAITDRIEVSIFGYNGKAITHSYILLWIVFTALLFILINKA